jgi:hypothetical protein
MRALLPGASRPGPVDVVEGLGRRETHGLRGRRPTVTWDGHVWCVWCVGSTWRYTPGARRRTSRTRRGPHPSEIIEITDKTDQTRGRTRWSSRGMSVWSRVWSVSRLAGRHGQEGASASPAPAWAPFVQDPGRLAVRSGPARRLRDAPGLKRAGPGGPRGPPGASPRPAWAPSMLFRPGDLMNRATDARAAGPPGSGSPRRTQRRNPEGQERQAITGVVVSSTRRPPGSSPDPGGGDQALADRQPHRDPRHAALATAAPGRRSWRCRAACDAAPHRGRHGAPGHANAPSRP